MTAASVALALSRSRAFSVMSLLAQSRSGMTVGSHHGASTQASASGAGGSGGLGSLAARPTGFPPTNHDFPTLFPAKFSF
jgi:hypothetical protein